MEVIEDKTRLKVFYSNRRHLSYFFKIDYWFGLFCYLSNSGKLIYQFMLTGNYHIIYSSLQSSQILFLAYASDRHCKNFTKTLEMIMRALRLPLCWKIITCSLPQEHLCSNLWWTILHFFLSTCRYFKISLICNIIKDIVWKHDPH